MIKNTLAALIVTASISNFTKVVKGGRVSHYAVVVSVTDGVRVAQRSIHIRHDVMVNPSDADEAKARAKEIISKLVEEFENEEATVTRDRMVEKEGPVELGK